MRAPDPLTVHYVISRSPVESFDALNRRRVALGLSLVEPATSIASLIREAHAADAAATRAWRCRHRLTVVPPSRAAPRWRRR